MTKFMTGMIFTLCILPLTFHTNDCLAQEVPGPIGITLKGKMFAAFAKQDSASKTFDSLKVGNVWGPEFRLQMQVGKFVDRLYFDIGYGLGWGTVKGNWNPETVGSRAAGLNDVTVMTYDASFIYKQPLTSALSVMIQPLFGFQIVQINSKPMVMQFTSHERLTNKSMGFSVNTGLEYKLTSFLRFGLGGGLQLFGDNNKWLDEVKFDNYSDWTAQSLTQNEKPEPKMQHTGLTLQAYTTFYFPFFQ